MLKKISEKISGLLIENNIVPAEQQEDYIYGLEIFLPQVVFYLFILIFALFSKTILPSLIFIIMYKLLRQYTGGFHCKTAGMCLVVSVLVYISMVLLYYLGNPMVDIILMIAVIFSPVIIFAFSPVESDNKPLEEAEKKKFRKLSIIITILSVLIVLIAFLFKIKSVFYPLSWSLSADAVLIILTLRRSNYEKNNTEGSGSNGEEKHYKI